MIFIMGLFIFDNSFLNIVTITFSALILTEFLNIYSEVFKNNISYIFYIHICLPVNYSQFYYILVACLSLKV